MPKATSQIFKNSFWAVIFFVFVAAFARNASANLVQDGDFTGVTYSGTLPMTTLYGEMGTGTGSTLTVANWSTTGYNFVYAPGTADAGTKTAVNSGSPNEAPGQYVYSSNGYGDTYLWGSNNGGLNTFTPVPTGGNFIAADGAFETKAIQQTITGLTVGQAYLLKFYWAGAQQESFMGATTDQWQVTFGSQTFTTGTVSVPSMGFSDWMQQTFTYTATSTTQTLSFLAIGTPTGQPPFALLGGVDLEVLPEVTNWMIFAGFGVAVTLFEAARRRRRRPETAVAS